MINKIIYIILNRYEKQYKHVEGMEDKSLDYIKGYSEGISAFLQALIKDLDKFEKKIK